MSLLIPKSFSYFFTSSQNLNNQAKNVSSDGSSFSVQLASPIQIPRGAVACTLEVTQASVWNNMFNISAQIGNNQFRYDPAGAGYTTLTIPDGQYSLSALNDVLAAHFVAEALDEDYIQIGADEPTQKAVLIFKVAATLVDFREGVNSCRDVLGFNAREVTAPVNNHPELGDDVAKFNRVNSLLIKTNLIGNGIPVNNKSNGVIASIPISEAPGTLIVYNPPHPITADATSLVGGVNNYFSFWLLDQEERPVDTNGESYSFVVVIKYFLLMTNENVPMSNI